MRLTALTTVAAALALAACTSSGDHGAQSSSTPIPTTTGISAWGIVGAPLRKFECPDPIDVMQGKFSSIQNYESIEGTVIEYTFCRNGWFSTPEPDPRLDMSNPQLVADVTDALAQPDQTAGPAPDCPNDPPRWQLPVIVRTTSGMWLVHTPLLPCGQDPLYPVADQLTALRAATGKVTGIVRMYGGPPDANGNSALHGSPGRNWPVKVLSGSHVVATTTTDAEGHFSFDLPPGTYVLGCSREKQVEVTLGTTTVAECKVDVR